MSNFIKQSWWNKDQSWSENQLCFDKLVCLNSPNAYTVKLNFSNI